MISNEKVSNNHIVQIFEIYNFVLVTFSIRHHSNKVLVYIFKIGYIIHLPALSI